MGEVGCRSDMLETVSVLSLRVFLLQVGPSMSFGVEFRKGSVEEIHGKNAKNKERAFWAERTARRRRWEVFCLFVCVCGGRY